MVPKNHELGCMCSRCTADVLGRWFDLLGTQTTVGRWQVFLTITFSTKSYAWVRGFPSPGSTMPSPGFGHRVFDDFVSQLATQLGSRVDYILCDQTGRRGRRFHQHALLAADGLGEYPRLDLEKWLRRRAGWTRALPFERGAAFYLGRYIGRNLDAAEWDIRVGNDKRVGNPGESAVGHSVIATSAELPKALFHQTMPGRRR
jgi:hypothetical protein